MKLGDFLAGIEILRKYYNEPDGYHLAAHRDEIGLYPTDRPISSEDMQRMIDLGWFYLDKGWNCYV